MERAQYGVSLAMAVALSMTAAAQAAQTGGDFARSLRANVVRIEAREHGFGFIVGEKEGTLYIATPYHVVADPNPSDAAEARPAAVQVTFFGGQGESVPATLLGTHDAALDLAVLKVPAPRGLQWNKRCLGSAEQRKPGTEVWFIGRSDEWFVPQDPGK